MTKTLALAIHFHQPVGNLDEVLRRATDRCYRPFLDVLGSHPRVPATLHYSGCLLEWLELSAPDVIDALAELVGRGQVELMTGGLYEPILAALPHRDQVGQIEALTERLEHRFGATPTGLWLTERVWEPDVIPALTEAGVRYTVLDDTMFHSVGIADDAMTGPFVTEHEGKPLLVYPGDRNLRYLIPYKRVERVTDYISKTAGDRLFVYGDDGEKFGEWPDTAERVYGRGWLDGFLGHLQQQEWLELTTLGAHAAGATPAGRVYLPSSSYDEMMTWALPTDARLRLGRERRRLAEDDPAGVLGFLRGAPWRSFLAKYPEMNQLQKRMLRVSDEVHAAGAPADSLVELYRAQCNCSYWHGSFGGVYLAFMRSALWHHLMRAEARVKPVPGITVTDLDADLNNEVIVHADWGAAVIAPHLGGSVLELDDHRVGANLFATMTRYREAYHVEDEDPPEEPGDDEEMAASATRATTSEEIVFDDFRRAGLVDRLDGRVIERYEPSVDEDRLFMSHVLDDLRVDKRVQASSSGLKVTYRITNTSARSVTREFATSSSVLPLCLGRETQASRVENEEHGLLVTAPEAEAGMRFRWSRQPEISIMDIETHAATLEGLQPMLQGTEVTLTWNTTLAPKESVEIGLEIVSVATPPESKKDLGVSA